MSDSESNVRLEQVITTGFSEYIGKVVTEQLKDIENRLQFYLGKSMREQIDALVEDKLEKMVEEMVESELSSSSLDDYFDVTESVEQVLNDMDLTSQVEDALTTIDISEYVDLEEAVDDKCDTWLDGLDIDEKVVDSLRRALGKL